MFLFKTLYIVSEVILPSRETDFVRLKDLVLDHIIHDIASMFLPKYDMPDKLIWSYFRQNLFG